jgi:hypothetical protein
MHTVVELAKGWPMPLLFRILLMHESLCALPAAAH